MMSTPLTYLPCDRGLELEHRGVAGQHLLRVAEAPADDPPSRRPPTLGPERLRLVARQRLARRLQVELGEGLALLRRVDDRRVEDDVVVEQLVETARAACPAGSRATGRSSARSSVVLLGGDRRVRNDDGPAARSPTVSPSGSPSRRTPPDQTEDSPPGTIRPGRVHDARRPTGESLTVRTTSIAHSRRAAVAAVLVGSLLLAACGGSSSDGASGDNADTDAKATTTTAAPVTAAPAGEVADGPAVPSAGCGNSSTGMVTLEKQYVDDSDRWFLLTTPEENDGETPLPLVFDIHGLMEGADVHALMTEMSAFSQENGFILVTPHGTGNPVRWEVEPDPETNPDLQYFETLLDQLEAEQCIDTSRVYSTGLSNGAFMSSVLGCTMADRIAAVAPVAGVIHPEGCEPSRPVPLLGFHGTADRILLFNGGVGTRLNEIMSDGLDEVGAEPPSLPEVDLNGEGYPANAQEWATDNGCTGDPIDEDITDIADPAHLGLPGRRRGRVLHPRRRRPHLAGQRVQRQPGRHHGRHRPRHRCQRPDLGLLPALPAPRRLTRPAGA